MYQFKIVSEYESHTPSLENRGYKIGGTFRGGGVIRCLKKLCYALDLQTFKLQSIKTFLWNTLHPYRAFKAASSKKIKWNLVLDFCDKPIVKGLKFFAVIGKFCNR